MTWKRLHILAEGPTEEGFANEVIKPHLNQYEIDSSVQCIITKRIQRGADKKGGLTDYRKAREHLVHLMNEHRDTNCFFTTMFDIYHMPSATEPEKSFPGYETAMREIKAANFEAGLDIFAQKIKEDLVADVPRVDRLIPYFQLHEFEALIFADLNYLRALYPVACGEVQFQLLEQALHSAQGDPEKINHEQGPAARIIEQIKIYKKLTGITIAENIGLYHLRQKCHFFNVWLTKLETL